MFDSLSKAYQEKVLARKSPLIKPCFGEKGDIGNKTVHVDAKPLQHLNGEHTQAYFLF